MLFPCIKDKGEQSTPTPVDEFDEEVKLQSPEPPKANKASAEEVSGWKYLLFYFINQPNSNRQTIKNI